MKSNIIKLTVGFVAILLMSASAHAGYTMKKKVGDVDTKLTLFGFAQLEARGGDAMIGEDPENKVAFGAQRIRLGWKYVAGNLRGKVFLDFNQDHDNTDAVIGDGAAMPKMIKDAFISYVASPDFVIKAGLIKMPNGMSFTMPGWNLDIAERGFDKKLALERNTGLMFSGRDMFLGNNGKVNGFEMGHERPWKGFGYDIMIANQASRSASATSSKNGGNSYAARLMFDYTQRLHIEASYALTENAGDKSTDTSVANITTGEITTSTTNNYGTTEDYSNINIGIDSNLGALSLKAEYFDATNLKGVKDWNEQVLTATVGYFVRLNLEFVAKHLQGSSEKSGTSTDLSNTYLGFNLFLSSPSEKFSRKAKRGRNQHKVVFNYILASGDTDTWNGNGGYKSDGFIAQYQFKF